MRKVLGITLLIVCIGVVAIFIPVKRVDQHHAAERRAWKNAAIKKINNDLQAPDYLEQRFGEIPKKVSGDFDSSEDWLTTDTIVCKDASWFAYRAECHKEDPKVHDIFIAKGSDGKWYYTDFHFCVRMMVLNDQPASLAEFKHRYFLAEFDGVSDAALERSWIPVGELR
jgi:hypothetical protein